MKKIIFLIILTLTSCVKNNQSTESTFTKPLRECATIPRELTIVGKSKTTSQYGFDNYTFGIHLENFLLMVDQSFGIKGFDISDPKKPRFIYSLKTNSWPQRVELEGKHIYLFDFNNGVRLFDISNPCELKEISSIDTNGKALGGSVVKDLVFIADEEKGFKVVKGLLSNSPKLIFDMELEDKEEFVIDMKANENTFAFTTTNNRLLIYRYKEVESTLEIEKVKEERSPQTIRYLEITDNKLNYISAGNKLKQIDLTTLEMKDTFSFHKDTFNTINFEGLKIGTHNYSGFSLYKGEKPVIEDMKQGNSFGIVPIDDEHFAIAHGPGGYSLYELQKEPYKVKLLSNTDMYKYLKELQ